MDMGFPSNEAETIVLFRLLGQDRLGWRIAYLQTAFPDAVIENKRSQRLTVEFEYEAKNFKRHKHPADGCDLILCYRNSWPDAPLPVWALEDCLCEEAEKIGDVIKGRLKGVSGTVRRLSQEASRWQQKAEQAEERIECLEQEDYVYDDAGIDIEDMVRRIIEAIPDDFPKWTIPPAIMLLIFSCCLSMVFNDGYSLAAFFLTFIFYAAVVLSIYLHRRQYGAD